MMFCKRRFVLLSMLVFFLNLDALCPQISVPLSPKGERHIVVVIASYNNSKYCVKNLDSVFAQKYENYHIIYINDCSTDSTPKLVESHIKKRGMENRVVIISNDVRCGALYNQYHAIHEHCADTDLVVILDGDDWFFGTQVFSYLDSVYSNHNIWLTYGQFVQSPTGDRGWCVNMPHDIVKNNTFRSFVHAPGHLRTFYAGLFKQIKIEDLMYEGAFLKMTGDIAAMFPMIEMARDGHFKFISKVLMVWNGANALNDHKVIRGMQRDLDIAIRLRRPYDKIEMLFKTNAQAA